MGFVRAAAATVNLPKRVGREYLKVLGSCRVTRGFFPSSIDRLSKSHCRATLNKSGGALREVMKSVEYPEGYFYVESTRSRSCSVRVAQLPRRSSVWPGLVMPPRVLC